MSRKFVKIIQLIKNILDVSFWKDFEQISKSYYLSKNKFFFRMTPMRKILGGKA